MLCDMKNKRSFNNKTSRFQPTLFDISPKLPWPADFEYGETDFFGDYSEDINHRGGDNGVTNEFEDDEIKLEDTKYEM